MTQNGAMGFWALRTQAYRQSVMVVLLWDIGRAAIWGAAFWIGTVVHDALLTEQSFSTSLRLMIAVTTFGTFLASFVLSVMSNTGKRELDVCRSASAIAQMEERLRWLLSDQLIMVVSALAAAAAGLLWLALAAVVGSPPIAVSGLAFAFCSLAIFNALRLPFQMWELHSSALAQERERAYQQMNEKTESLFRD